MRPLLTLGLATLTAMPADAAPVAAEPPVYRCVAQGRVTYRDLACASDVAML